MIAALALFCITFTTPPPQAPTINLRRTTPLLAANADEPQYIPPTALLCTTAALQSACFGCIGTALPPALRASEERAVVIRHFFKLLIRAPMVNCVLLGGKLDGFHAYQLKQLVMMVTSPTFFATLFAVKTTRGLSAVALVNVSFVAACALSMW